MAHIRKFRDVEVELPNVRVGLDGYFQFRAFKGVEFPRGSGQVFETAGTERWLGGIGPDHVHFNIITNLCLENYGAYYAGSGWIGNGVTQVTGKDNGMFYCHVGTGTATPAVTDTVLASFTASIQVDHGLGLGTYWAQGSPPYYGAHRYKARFSPGFGGGAVNLNEVGMSYTLATGNLSSRALTVNGSGVPTTLTVLADEYLDVYYTRRNYPPHISNESLGTPADDTGTVDIDGTTYNYTLRPAYVTNNDWGQQIPGGFAPVTGFNSDFSEMDVYSQDATLGAVTTGPSAADSDGNVTGTLSRAGWNSYTTNSYNRTVWYRADIDACVVSQGGVTGFKAMVVKSTFGAIQILLDGVVPKDNTKVYTYYHNWSWTRK